MSASSDESLTISTLPQISISRLDIMTRIPLIVSEINHDLAKLQLKRSNISPTATEGLLQELMACMIEQQAEIFLLQSRLEKVEKIINSRKNYRRRFASETAIINDKNNTSDIHAFALQEPIITAESSSGYMNGINETPSTDIVTNISEDTATPAPPLFFASSSSGVNPFSFNNKISSSSSSRSHNKRSRYKVVSYEDLCEEERKLQEAAIKQNCSNNNGMFSNVLGIFGKKALSTTKFTTDELAAQVAAGILKPSDALDASKPPPIITPY